MLGSSGRRGRAAVKTGGRWFSTFALLAALVPLAVPQLALADPSPNDNRANATDLGALPAGIDGTTVGATVEPTTEPGSSCGLTGGSVWYRFTTSAMPPDRIAVRLRANGDLDAVIDVYVRQRSQSLPVSCDATDTQGEAALSLRPAASTTYLIRVAQLSNSVSGSFHLDVFPLPPPANPPGPRLAPGGASGTLERVLDASAAYSSTLAAGVSYRMNLVSRIDTGCMHVQIFPPGTQSFDDTPISTLPCQGYRVFTPRVSGRFSFVVQAALSFRGPQRYHLQVAPGTPATTIPGVFMRNYQTVHGFLRGNRIDVLRLYRFDVTDRSDLELDLHTGSSNPFNLQLLNGVGSALACQCDSTGDQSVILQLNPGRYFAVVRARDFSSGGFTLFRRSRSITHTDARINGSYYVETPPGASVSIRVGVTPAVAGPATIEIDRFDPIAGWQFFRLQNVNVTAGSATVSFVPPHTGQWLVHANFLGSRGASPSQSGYARVLSAGPLTQ